MTTDQTPALARATKSLRASGALHIGTPVDPISTADLMVTRDALTAALHDPDDPDWLARVIDPEAFGDAAFVPDPRSLVGMVLEGRRATARRRSANLVAAILGDAS